MDEVTFNIPLKLHTSRVYLKKLKMKYQGMFMYVAYGSMAFEDGSLGCLASSEDYENSQLPIAIRLHQRFCLSFICTSKPENICRGL